MVMRTFWKVVDVVVILVVCEGEAGWRFCAGDSGDWWKVLG